MTLSLGGIRGLDGCMSDLEALEPRQPLEVVCLQLTVSRTSCQQVK